MDKSDLEDLLVKLKLETVTVDDVIDELRSLNIKRERRSQSLPAIYKNCVLAKDKSTEYLSELISSYLSSKSDFIMLNVVEKKASELAQQYDGLSYSSKAEILYRIKNSNKKNRRKIIILSSLYADERLVNEVVLLADIFGFDASTVSDLTVSNIKTFNDFNSSKNHAIILISGNDYALETIIAGDCTQPVLSIRDVVSVVDNISAKLAGVINIDSRVAFSAFPILQRLADKK